MDTRIDSRKVTFDQSMIKSSLPKNSHQNNLKKPTAIDSLGTLLSFALAMLIIPLGIYYLAHEYSRASATNSALCAAVAVQVMVFIFVVKAFKDDKTKHTVVKTVKCNHASKSK